MLSSMSKRGTADQLQLETSFKRILRVFSHDADCAMVI